MKKGIKKDLKKMLLLLGVSLSATLTTANAASLDTLNPWTQNTLNGRPFKTGQSATTGKAQLLGYIAPQYNTAYDVCLKNYTNNVYKCYISNYARSIGLRDPSFKVLVEHNIVNGYSGTYYYDLGMGNGIIARVYQTYYNDVWCIYVSYRVNFFAPRLKNNERLLVIPVGAINTENNLTTYYNTDTWAGGFYIYKVEDSTAQALNSISLNHYDPKSTLIKIYEQIDCNNP